MRPETFGTTLVVTANYYKKNLADNVIMSLTSTQTQRTAYYKSTKITGKR